MYSVGNSNSQNQNMSYFDGSTWQLIGYRILSVIVCIITLGIAYPWMLCMVQGWETGHTVINGRRLKFNGHGHQLIGRFLLWVFLTVITFGIYGIWFGLGMKKWVVKHTFYADEEEPVDSYFSGGAGGYLGIHILSFMLTLFTLGFGKAWADTMVLKWEINHTHIGGSPLKFSGTGGQLFAKYLLLVLLTPLTLGIYALCFTVIYMKWQVKNTEAVYQTPEIQAQAKAHETTVMQDFVKYRLAANDQEVTAVKSGYTGKEDDETLERLAEENNPFASYHLAKQLKGDGTRYEGRALELLQKAADSKYHLALLDLAKQLPPGQAISMLTEAAQCGNAEASWLLATKYQEASDLTQAVYWFKVALEWGVSDAKNHADEYDALVKSIALRLSEKPTIVGEPKGNNVTALVLGIAGFIISIIPIIIFIIGSLYRFRIVRFVFGNRIIPIIVVLIGIIGLIFGIAEMRKNGKGKAIAGIILNLMCIAITIFNVVAGLYPGYLWIARPPVTSSYEESLVPQEWETGETHFDSSYYDSRTDEPVKDNTETPVILEDIIATRGRYYTLVDENGFELEYLIDESAYFDREEQVLYIQFGVAKCEVPVYLRCENGWCTQGIVPGFGITQVSYPYEEPPSSIELWSERGYLINSHPLNVTEGTSAEVAEWFQQKYGFGMYLDSVETPLDEIDFTQGTCYSVDAFGDYDHNIEYIINESAYFDRDRQVLYIQFGLTMQCEDWVWLRFENGLCTQVFPGFGITQVSYPYEEPPSSIEVWTERGYFIIINSHPLNVTEGTSAEAEEWLEEKYGFNNQKDEISTANAETTEEMDLSKGIVGEWEYREEFKNVYADAPDEPVLEISGWIFNSDGTYESYGATCNLLTDSTYYNYYYNGKYWMIVAGYGSSGSYTINGDEITIHGISSPEEYEFTNVYKVEYLDGEVICLFEGTGNFEYRRVN